MIKRPIIEITSTRHLQKIVKEKVLWYLDEDSDLLHLGSVNEAIQILAKAHLDDHPLFIELHPEELYFSIDEDQSLSADEGNNMVSLEQSLIGSSIFASVMFVIMIGSAFTDEVDVTIMFLCLMGACNVLVLSGILAIRELKVRWSERK